MEDQRFQTGLGPMSSSKGLVPGSCVCETPRRLETSSRLRGRGWPVRAGLGMHPEGKTVRTRWPLGLRPVAPYHHINRTESHMLWTILIILAIVALVLFILGRTRGRRGV